MAENDYVGTTRRVIARAIDEASDRGALAVEAEHLLLALAEDDGAAASVLAEFGLDARRIDELLHDERRAALAAVGFVGADDDRLVATARRSRPGWGASAKEAIVRGAKLGHRDRQRIRESDLLLGILLAELGTVPRALHLGDVDREAVIGRLQRLAHASTR
ncbi:Clp protease N-terminal domain-containing protein [Agromyces sp. MMS24-JH15]|uniref:Clp protease N-terminal domain-containing protein n=1 Tax=Agromyces sp. MMS24-JH15 TaxID=3243765 RepID=UPI003748DA08